MSERKVLKRTMSCPVCGASRKPEAFNVDPTTGQHNDDDPVVYAHNYKLCTSSGYCTLAWETYAMPRNLLIGLRAQLEFALAQVDAALQRGEDP
jgi:hypothetical protein